MLSFDQFVRGYAAFPALGLNLDFSRIGFNDAYIGRTQPALAGAFAAMKELEAGAIANPDEQRQVGHYWLRAPDLAPDPVVGEAIRTAVRQIKDFAANVHSGAIRGSGGLFKHILLIGIGGSALGPMFVAHALGHPCTDRLDLRCFDNTDPDGMDRVLASLKGELGQTLVIVVSKSGSTKETANGMKEAEAAYRAAGLDFGQHTVAVTVPDSSLSKHARKARWLDQFPMWDWVGGRTSETAAVGLLPAALQGFDIDALLEGARVADATTRVEDWRANPAALLALAWHFLGEGRGLKDMVVIPYKDRLELFSRYLQQLVMESLGKELDLKGDKVEQGLSVFGNKGSTDQHAYIQQLRDGIRNFFVVFIQVLRDRAGESIEVGPAATSGDYLTGFLLGTRTALHDNGRPSMTLTLETVSAFSVGVLIAVFERAVGLYAGLINVNAYHQPGVQAGKLAADRVLELQSKVLAFFAGYRAGQAGPAPDARQIAAALGVPEQAEYVFKICEHLAANPGRGVIAEGGLSPSERRFAPQSLSPT
jgi:glucose-6-phosphate isomerase